MVTRKLLWIACAAVVVAPPALPGIDAAGNLGKTTALTFSQPVRLPGVALGAGTYIFEIANPDSGADVVRVMDRDRTTAYFMGFTRAVTRPHGMPREQAVSLGESAAGSAPPITVWWPGGESTGRQFIYPRAR